MAENSTLWQQNAACGLIFGSGGVLLFLPRQPAILVPACGVVLDMSFTLTADRVDYSFFLRILSSTEKEKFLPI